MKDTINRIAWSVNFFDIIKFSKKKYENRFVIVNVF